MVNHKGLPEPLFKLRKKLYIKAKQEPKFRFYALYDRIYRQDVLAAAWAQVVFNNGSPGVDGVSIKAIQTSPEHEAAFLEEIHQALKEKRYRPQAVRRVMIEKANGGERPLGIPTLRDRVVQTATKLILEPIFEADFLDTSYGFRPKRSAHQALGAITDQLRQGRTAIYDADLKAYFDTIPHDKLMACVEMRITDRGVLKLIRQWLKAPIEEDGGKGKPGQRKREGTPQGGVISPLLANLYLHWFDKRFHQQGGPAQFANAKIIRYADDFVIMARFIGTGITDWVEATAEGWMGLSINRKKTKIVNLREPQAVLNFLGYSYRYDKDLQGRDHRYLNLFPSKESCARRREKVRQKLCSKTSHVPIPELIKQLNHQLKGWACYFSEGYPRKSYREMNSFVRQRLINHLKRRSQRPYRPRKGETWYQHLHGKLGLVPL
ncbi:MAG: group II intron reverse transcriptase/maturase [Spartobacteria bacterium]|nr:group II intron reverse transcriptase/maturase [Spartobacteria bacterium]